MPGMTGSVVLQRCSDADRERTSERLRNAAAEGYLTMDEMEDRLTGVYAAKHGHELDALVLDLPRKGRLSQFSGGGARLGAVLTMLVGRRGIGGTRRRVLVGLALGTAVLALLGAGAVEGLDLFEGADDDGAAGDTADDAADADD